MKNSNQHNVCLTEQELLAYVNREMTPEELRNSEIHITDCELCSDAIEGFKLVQEDRSTAIVAELKKSINKKLEGKVRSIGINLNWLQIAAVLFIIGLSAGSYLYIQKVSTSNMALQNEEVNLSTESEGDTLKNKQQQNTINSVPSEATIEEKTSDKLNENISKVNSLNENKEELASATSTKDNESSREDKSLYESENVSSGNLDDGIKQDNQSDVSVVTSAPAVADDKFSVIKNEEVTSGSTTSISKKEILESEQNARLRKYKAPQSASGKTTNFEKGKTLYQNEKYEEALVILEPVSINKSDINHDEAIWLCANIKHKQNKNEEARKLLLQLSESPLFKYKAEKLLNKL